MNCFSEDQLARISHLVREIEKLTDVEKLFLYLQLPCGRADASEAGSKSSQRFNGSTAGGIQKSLDLFAKKPDQETTQTYTWILSHLEIDPNVSLPKQEVYDEYRAFCQSNRFEPLCVADFGKAMKHAFPCIKPRRLGQRGNSRYCYSGLRKRYKLQPPNLPDMDGADEPGAAVMYCTMTNCDQQTTTTTTNSNIQTSSSNFNNRCITDSSTNNNHHPSSSDNSNGTNMTSTKNNGNECSALADKRQTIYNRPEVMNLKIEPNNHNLNGGIATSGVLQFTDESPTQAGGKQSLYSGFQLEELGGGQSSSSSSNRLAHHHQQPHQPHHLQQHPAGSSSSASSYDGGSAAAAAGQHHLLLSHHNSRYTTSDYNSRTIQQPGTPDDDDYRHNYQDMQPLSGHFLSSSTSASTNIGQPHHAALLAHHGNQAPPVAAASSGTHHQAGNTTGYHGYSLQATQPFGVTTNPISSENSPMQLMQHANAGSKFINSVIQSQAPFNNANLTNSSSGSHLPRPAVGPPTSLAVAAGSGGAAHHLINHHMNVTHMDACASPFQSPAPTPYPSMSGAANYPMQDMMQDFCSSGCRLYQSS